MQGQDSGILTWCVAVHWVHRLCGLPGGAGQGQLPPMFCLGHPATTIKQSQMVATCIGLGGSQVKPNCDPEFAAASAGPGALGKKYGGWKLWRRSVACLRGFRKL